MNMLAQLKPTILNEYVGTQFEVLDDPSRAFHLTLTNVIEHVSTEHQETFSIYFHGPTDAFIPQGIHRLNHDRLGNLDIFLVPVSQDKDGFEYEAVFNHTIH